MKVPVTTPIVKDNKLPTEDFVFFLQSLQKDNTTLSDVNIAASLLLNFNLARTATYTEYTYTGTNITKIEIWTDSTKTTKLFTKTLSYSGDKLSGYTMTDHINSKTLTAIFSYSGDKLVSRNLSIS